jgi:putative ABC transport system permease protein
MFRNYIVTSLRKFRREPVYALINITGLVFGLACSMLTSLWVLDELSFNNYDPDNRRVFRVMENQFSSDGVITTGIWSPGILAETFKAQIAEVEQASRMASSDAKLFRAGEKAFYEYGNYADPALFEVLNLPLLEGDRRNTLPDRHSIAISKKMASRLFNDARALGNTLQMNNGSHVTVTAVFEDIPRNATVKFDFILPMERFIQEDKVNIYRWDNDGWIENFVKLKDEKMQSSVDEKIKGLIKAHNKDFHAELFLFPFSDWRLYAEFENGKPSGGRIVYVISFCIVALFTLGIACINFMNLATARATTRAKEVGVRKVTGASRGILIRQFMTESMLLALSALGVALLLVHLALPAFNTFIKKELTIDYGNPIFTGGILIITLCTGLLAGSYPAFVLSAFRPVLALKGNLKSDLSGASVRKALVVFQFSLSIIIMVCALTVSDQITYMRRKNLGFDKSNVIMIRSNPEIFKNYEGFRHELLQQRVIASVGLGAANPMEINGEGGLEWEGKPADDDSYFNMANCDYDYVETLGFTLVQGRNFSRNFPADTANYIITESAARKMGFADPIGRYIRNNGREGQIIGVIKDFHNLGIRETYHATVLTLGRSDDDFGRWASLFVRYEPGKTDEALAWIRSVYPKSSPVFPIQFSFLDEDFEWQFSTELMAASLIKSFTAVAVIISCLGLFGLALFSTEKRKKEISIRKVLGASMGRLVALLCTDFVKLMIYAIGIACPIAYYFAEMFLSEYVYRTTVSSWTFMAPGLAMLLVSMSIVTWQALKAAMSNPVDAMRGE